MLNRSRKKYYLNKNKTEISFGQRLVISFILFVLMTLIGFLIVEKQIRPAISNIAQMETQKIGTSIIEYAVSRSEETVNLNETLKYELDPNGNLIYYYFDTEIYKNMLTSLIANSQEYIHLLEKGTLIEDIEAVSSTNAENDGNEIRLLYNIPLGHATGSSLLASLGPKVPIEFIALADIDVDLNERAEQLGINNTFLRMAIDFEVNAKIIIPFATYEDPVSTTIPVGFAFIPGEVPQFYSGNSNGLMPTLPLPMQEEVESTDQNQ
ncbi:sporulation protein YunB [Alkalihalobacillus pseudalcaliphilus]|uniref:sporulation protein YunB n=1 Tax=Alkalihalobacillus pseudalcaliphilus TaxID=79884 RepID=UPI00064D79D0|nr:sporulation protein YunB [Alkalihalobacillus pseudalcaliphilus]KMK75772.1 hypothetical protein AB990_10920 [Alkalihalobacillus pseudalcaliphilus]